MPTESISSTNNISSTENQDTFGGAIPSIVEDITQPNTNITMTLSQKLVNIFPQSLESSGYVILASIAMIFCLFITLFILKMQKAILVTQNNTNTLKEMTVSLFINQQSIEYKILLDEFNKAESTTDKLNAKTQLWNFLNKVCREICETKDLYLAINLGIAFFSKIQGRYMKMGVTPDGIVYFKAVGDLLLKYGNSLTGATLVKKIRSEYKRGVSAQQKLIKEIAKEEHL